MVDYCEGIDRRLSEVVRLRLTSFRVLRLQFDRSQILVQGYKADSLVFSSSNWLNCELVEFQSKRQID